MREFSRLAILATGISWPASFDRRYGKFANSRHQRLPDLKSFVHLAPLQNSSCAAFEPRRDCNCCKPLPHFRP